MVQLIAGTVAVARMPRHGYRGQDHFPTRKIQSYGRLRSKPWSRPLSPPLYLRLFQAYANRAIMPQKHSASVPGSGTAVMETSPLVENWLTSQFRPPPSVGRLHVGAPALGRCPVQQVEAVAYVRRVAGQQRQGDRAVQGDAARNRSACRPRPARRRGPACRRSRCSRQKSCCRRMSFRRSAFRPTSSCNRARTRRRSASSNRRSCCCRNWRCGSRRR